jgi:glyoxylase-like metal-dependent hydrolase (beta-lactamase superfamily II)
MRSMIVLAAGMRYVDLNFQGIPRVIATAIVDGPDGVTLVDPGPTSSLPALRASLEALGVRLPDVSTVLLTHIHLDHAGVTGTLVRAQPRLTVYVHERGARHMIDPSRLLESAQRLYGDFMDRLWGEFLPVPAENVRPLAGGECIEAAGRRFDVAYTPGHASHHVSYFDAGSGVAFVGDTCGARIGETPFVMPPTPPPDIDLTAWHASLDRVLAWGPRTLFLTHFGPTEHPGTHIEDLRERLELAARIVRDALARHPDPGEDAAAAAVFRREMARELRRHMDEPQARSYETAVPLDHCYLGLARYWRKRGLAA